ncbi:hypothetical protein BDZ97DRAFT_1140594 [Flammula alnicola]|nr:hypothetical protein BDZ97DRAFT_1140594 [Flammula alnicola]
MASSAGAPAIVSLGTIKSDVVGLGAEGDDIAETLDETKPGWKVSKNMSAWRESAVCLEAAGSIRPARPVCNTLSCYFTKRSLRDLFFRLLFLRL